MKKIIIMISVTLLPSAVGAQINKVLNPLLEQFSTCPDNIDEITYCTHWNTLDSVWRAPDWTHEKPGVPEYINGCSTYFNVTEPSNAFGFQFPHSGRGMMSVQMYSDDLTSPNERDYMQGHLSQTLIAGHQYYVCFYTVLEELGGYAINHIGAYIDDGSIDTANNPGKPQTQCTPQILDTSIIIDTMHWTKIDGTFTAIGNEKFITIGNFYDRAHTTHNSVSWGTATSWAWYGIDDVSVIDCSNEPFAGNDTFIHVGDSILLGSHETLLPYTWYILGNPTPIDSGGGIWVHPTVNTTYVLEQKLCGITKYDTVKVYTTLDVNNTQPLDSKVKLYPNPVTNKMVVDGMKGLDVILYDIAGREVMHTTIVSDKQVMDITDLQKGIYLVQVVENATGAKVVRKMQKE